MCWYNGRTGVGFELIDVCKYCCLFVQATEVIQYYQPCCVYENPDNCNYANVYSVGLITDFRQCCIMTRI